MGGTSSTSGYSIALAIYNGQRYIAFNDSAHYYVTLMTLGTSGSWASVAHTSDMIDEDYAQSLTVSGGSLYLSCYNSANGAVFLTYNGSTLTPIGTLGSISGGDSIEYVSGAVYNGVPYVAFDDETRDSDPEPRAATVKYYNNGSWQLYAGYPDSCDIEDTFLAVDDTNGKLYLTYSDCNGYMTVAVH